MTSAFNYPTRTHMEKKIFEGFFPKSEQFSCNPQQQTPERGNTAMDAFTLRDFIKFSHLTQRHVIYAAHDSSVSTDTRFETRSWHTSLRDQETGVWLVLTQLCKGRGESYLSCHLSLACLGSDPLQQFLVFIQHFSLLDFTAFFKQIEESLTKSHSRQH